jgi:hypothetical protein
MRAPVGVRMLARFSESSMPQFLRVPALASAFAAAALGAAAAHAKNAPAQAAASCANHTPLRQALFGDLHVHTAISMDAWIMGTRLRPDDAYRFARGEEVRVAPMDAEGHGTRAIRQERPLDFVAVTDHSENFGSVGLCTAPGSAIYDAEDCKAYRGESQELARAQASADADLGSSAKLIIKRMMGMNSALVCGADGERCREAGALVWQEIQNAAARWNDAAPSCGFTSLIGYEYSLTPELTKIHRNVIFRNSKVLPLPISSIDEPDPKRLWKRLEKECQQSGTGCDVLAIPHNPNLANGQMFALEYGAGASLEEQIELAKLRSRMEPLVEIFQMKGDSECANGMWGVAGAPDELCDFEKLRSYPKPPEDCKDGVGKGALGGQGCSSRIEFVRYALIHGLKEADRIGVNPLQLGFIGSTDIHSGTPAPVEEYRTDIPSSSGAPIPGMNPGGVAGVWAEENSRESIFQALRRRETFATSGPRIQPRFFGGWDYPSDLCSRGDMLERAYAGGVAMGSELPARAGGSAIAPIFAVSALRDPGTAAHPGTPLQRIQIVKGWVGDDGTYHQQVNEVAGSPANGASVDLATCEPRGAGHDSLCRVWRDPDFDPTRRAVYYARVVENPTCRQSTWACNALPAAKRAPGCSDPRVSKTVQERAWTSPIWYTPPALSER